MVGVLDDIFTSLLIAAKALLPIATHPTLDSWRDTKGLSVIVMISTLLITGVAVTNIAGMIAKAVSP